MLTQQEIDQVTVNYKTYRYLERLSPELLVKRYCNTLKSLFFYQNDAEKGFYNFLLSKKKIMETEFSLRGLSQPSLNINYQNHVPRYCITKYGEKCHVESMLYEGKFRFTLSREYNDKKLTEAQRDNELEKGFCFNKAIVNNVPIIGYVACKSKLINDQYIFCMSSEYNPNISLHISKDYDACLIVKNKKIFEQRILESVKEDFGICIASLSYYDPYEPQVSYDIFPLLNKDYIYSYQKEVRILMRPIENEISNINKYLYIEIGNIQDIAEIIYIR